MKKSEIKALDKLWSQRVKEKAGYKCESCLEEGWLNSCHIVGRAHRTTRWGCWIDGKYDLCGWSGCYACHRAYDSHLPKELFIRRVVIGNERYEKICNSSNEIAKNQDPKQIAQWIKEA